MNKGSLKLRMLAIGMLGIFPAAWAQSLGDLAREVRNSHPAQALKVYTNEDIPQVSNEVVWKSAASAAQTTPSMPGIAEQSPTSAIKLRSEDVECSFSFRAQSMVPRGKMESATVSPLPPSEVAKLDGTASIWGDTLDVSIHNDTGWSLREVTVRLLLGAHGDEQNSIHSHAAEHGSVADFAAADAGRLLDLRLSAEPHTATVSSEPLAQNLAGQEWSWEIVQAKGIPPK